MEAKICSHCRRGLPLTHYYKQKLGYLYAECKDCIKSRVTTYQKTTKGYAVKQRAWRKYHKLVDNLGRRAYYKTPKGRAYLRERNQTERCKKNNKRYQLSVLGHKTSAMAASRRRARLKECEGEFSIQEWDELVKEYGNSCAYCGCNDVKMTMDHVIPITKGGRHSMDNIVPACGICNSSKNNKLLDEWIPIATT